MEDDLRIAKKNNNESMIKLLSEKELRQRRSVFFHIKIISYICITIIRKGEYYEKNLRRLGNGRNTH